MTRACVRAHGQHSRDCAGLESQRLVPDRVYAWKLKAKATRVQSVRDRPPPDQDLEELGSGDHALLSHRKVGDRIVVGGLGAGVLGAVQKMG